MLGARDDLSQGCTVVLSHRFWQAHLGGQAGVVAQHHSRRLCAVIGIMPHQLRLFSRADGYVDTHHAGQRNRIDATLQSRPNTADAAGRASIREIVY
jgi:hypothetical protein